MAKTKQGTSAITPTVIESRIHLIRTDASDINHHPRTNDPELPHDRP